MHYNHIGLTFEFVNLMHKKSNGGNLVMKVDIKNIFDYINRLFFMQVLNQFGLSDIFTNLIWTILNFSKIYVSFNGRLHGFFKCGKGVKQIDPLSPLLF